MDDVNTGHERNLKFIHNKIEFRFTVLMSVQGLESDACTNYTYKGWVRVFFVQPFAPTSAY